MEHRNYASFPGDKNQTLSEKAIKKRPDISDRLVLADKTNCTGGVYRARTYDLHDVKCAQEARQRRSSEHNKPLQIQIIQL